MSSDHLHHPMGEAAIAIGQRYERELNALMQRAFDEALATLPAGDAIPRQNDAMSLLFELAAIAAAKALVILGERFPAAAVEQIWATGMLDLQMRIQANIDDFHAQRTAPGSMVQ
jgi:hypothetical protein